MVLDRAGEPIDADAAHVCRGGWLTPAGADEPRPCLECRPWLRERRPATRAELARFVARHPDGGEAA